MHDAHSFNRFAAVGFTPATARPSGLSAWAGGF
jgi:hypothetical protein